MQFLHHLISNNGGAVNCVNKRSFLIKDPDPDPGRSTTP